MHKLILWFFRNLNNVGQTLSLICSFLIMTTILYWLESIIKTQWNWLNFIKPVLDVVLDFANNLFPFTINAFGTVFDGKFITATIVLLCLMLIIRLIVEAIYNLEYYYDVLHSSHKKSVERTFNKELKDKVIAEESKILRYMVLINTRLKKKFTHDEYKISLLEQNNIMNKFIFKKTRARYEILNEGFLYRFDNFNKIDNIIDILFKLMKSPSPLEYSVCIQAGDNITQLNKLADLKFFDKIVFCADTLLRYKCNKFHRYGTQNVGIFQVNDNSIEVHEFHEIL